MARLILLHESGVAGEFQLQPGVNTVGRDPDNDLSVDHSSVSDHHCALELTASGVVVRDLGSAHGTWIDAVRIQEGRLDPGQTLLVGEVPFALQVPLRVGVKPPDTSVGQMTPPVQAAPIAESAESVHCPSCGRWWATSATRKQRTGLAILHFCPQCGRPCGGASATLGPGAGDQAPLTFARGLAEAFAYPLRSSGVWMVLSGALALLLAQYAAQLASYAFLLGLLALVILTVGVVGYYFAFIKQVIVTSASGANTLPGWPEILSPADFLEPFFHCLALLAVSFGPWLLWQVWGPDVGRDWMSWVLLGWGAFYCPMALVGLALADSVSGLNPAVIVPSILRLFGPYCAAVLLVGILLLAQLGSGWLAEALSIPFVSSLAVQFLSLYLLVVIARILGVTYYLHRDALGWFK
jgi:hypothetical protein